ncbi:glycosyltransferase family 4 protein [Aquidulcibacter sp.]|uniref:glycosyltransferase family 4 protein n=1 Tax=Aquidulcibacter sp. TaxID=2052990 RepID=UPI0025B89FA0|nr:glycosyltransferase family 4 protein [Aquidulcibacter sp.]MCA3695829.1 glycosyltransferase family 4 protein [Aquidulcibacter sp.]
MRVQRALTHHAAKYQPITHAIILPFFAQGGAEQTAWNFARAVHKALGSGVVIIAADRKLASHNVLDPPEGALLIDLETTFGEADYRDREALLLAVLRLCQADTMHIINSEVAWRLLIKAPASLQKIGKVFGSIFAFQYDWETRQRLGYAETFLRDALPYLDGLLSDNQRFLDDALVIYGLEREKVRFSTVYNPVRFSIEESDQASCTLWKEFASTSKQGRLQILWAGRLDREKRPELLIGTARLCPDMDFHVYGTKVVDDSDSVDISKLPNIFYHGPFTDPAAVVRDRQFHALMFTSRWEGMPNVVLEFGALGLPVVAARVGGLAELIDDQTGYPLPERAIAEDYADAFDDIATNPKEALARAAALRDRIHSRHTSDRFVQRLSEVPNYLPKNGASSEPEGTN